MTETFQTFFALLTIVAAVLGITLAVAHIARHRNRVAATIIETVAPAALWLGFAITATTTLGSLYFSEIANYTPCRLCWFQRIAMYPLTILFLVAAIRKDHQVRWYVWPLTATGAAISIYHYLLERMPQLDSGACAIDVPCTAIWFEEFGFITLPFMALAAFIAATALAGTATTSQTADTTETPVSTRTEDHQ